MAQRQVDVARFLRPRDVPAARLVLADSQPLVLDEGVVTLWRRLTVLDTRPGPEDLGRLARRLHRATAEVPSRIPALDPYSAIRECLDRIEETGSAEDLAALREELDELTEAFDPIRSDDPLGTALVHGDFHFENVLMTPDGPTLIDFEDSGRGPASWDLVPQRVAVHRYGAPEEHHRAFCRAYGADLEAWDCADLACRAYELVLISWAVAHRDASPAMEIEATVRMKTLRGSNNETWTML